MVPFGIDKTLDKSKMLEGRTPSIRRAVQSAFNRAMNHLSLIQDLGTGDWPPPALHTQGSRFKGPVKPHVYSTLRLHIRPAGFTEAPPLLPIC